MQSEEQAEYGAASCSWFALEQWGKWARIGRLARSHDRPMSR